jgi:hypothetical protein
VNSRNRIGKLCHYGGDLRNSVVRNRNDAQIGHSRGDFNKGPEESDGSCIPSLDGCDDVAAPRCSNGQSSTCSTRSNDVDVHTAPIHIGYRSFGEGYQLSAFSQQILA